MGALLLIVGATQSPTAQAAAVSWGYGNFVEIRTGNWMCVDVPNGSGANGERIQQWTCNGGGAQKFRYINKWNSWNSYQGMRIQNALSNKCLDIPWGNRYNGAPVQQYDCNENEDAQYWWSEKCNSAGFCQLKKKNSDQCLDVPNGTNNWGAKLQLWTCYGNAAQAFKWN